VEAPSQREERAARLAAPHLDDDGGLSDESIAALCRRHPELRAEFEAIRRGLVLFGRVRPTRAGPPLAARRRGLRKVLLAATATAATAAGLVAVTLLVRPAPQPPPSADLAMAEAAARMLAPMAEEAGRERLDRMTDRDLHALAGFYARANEIVDELRSSAPANAGDRAALEETGRRLREFAGGVGTGSPSPARTSLRGWIEEGSGEVEASPTLALLFAQQVERLADRFGTGNRAARSAAARRLLALATKVSLNEIVVFDLDDEGREFAGAELFVQRVDPFTGLAGEPGFVGITPMDQPFPLPLGDWRITVQDPEGRRHSELRMLSLPGPDVQRRVTFLRAHEEVVKGMAHRSACRFQYRRLLPGSKDAWAAPDEEVELGELWIDPFEVTNREYEEFLQSLRAHPEWFGAALPVKLPVGFTVAGVCTEDPRKPVVEVPWNDAVLYANWAGKRLPTSREWERVAEGATDRRFPWGDEFDVRRVDVARSLVDRFAEVAAGDGRLGFIPPGNPCGRVDDPTFAGGCTPADEGAPVWRLADNASEWIEDLECLPGSSGDPAVSLERDLLRTKRGAGWLDAGIEVCAIETLKAGVPLEGTPWTGFRCVRSPFPGFRPR